MTTDKGQMNDLDWSAFCYAAGELSVAETAAFETHLATDQSAREALARAVELTQLVAATELSQPLPVSVQSRSQATWQTRLAWMAIGGVASLLLGMAWMGGARPSSRAVGPLQRASQAQLAAAWSETLSQLQSADPELWSPASTTSELDDEFVATTELPMDDILAETPSWLDAAVGVAEDTSGD